MSKKKDELTPYSSDKLSKVKPGVKIGFLKFWVAGAVYLLSFSTPFFVSQDGSTEILMFFLLFVLITEYLVNKMIIWMNNDNQPTLRYLPFFYTNPKSVKGLGLTLVYALIMTPAILLTAVGMNHLLIMIGWNIPAYWLSGNPEVSNSPERLELIQVAFTYVLVDFIYLRIKWQVAKIHHNRYKRLTKKIKQLQLQQKSLSVDSTEYINLQAQIDAYIDNPCNDKKGYSIINKEIERLTTKLNLTEEQIKIEEDQVKNNKLKTKQTNLKIKIRDQQEKLRNLKKEINSRQTQIKEELGIINNTGDNNENI